MPNNHRASEQRSALRHVALVYARKSVVKTKRDEISPERQLSLCSDAAAGHGWTVETFIDAEGHRSGGSEKHRPEWRRLKAQLARSDVAAVVVADISRASRSPRDFYNFLDECDRRRVQFISLKEGIDTTTAQGRVMMGICLILAAFEREIASERASTAINFKRDNGKHVGNAPFGTKRDDQGVLVENEDWETCRAALEAYATGGQTLYSLAGHLNAQGMRFRNRAHEAVPFDRSSTRSIISNVLTYAGYVVRGHGKAITLPVDLDVSGDPVAALAEAVGAIKGKHAPFISRELAARIIRFRFQTMKSRSRQERRDYILVPILHCAECHEPLRGIVQYGQHRYRHRRGSCAARSVRLDADRLEHEVLEQLADLRLSTEQRADLRRRIEERLRSAPEDRDVYETIANLERKRDRLRKLFIEGDIDEAMYEQERTAARRSIEEQQAKLGPRVSLESIFDQLDDLAAIIAQGTSFQQRRALADLFERIEVDSRGEIARMEPKPWANEILIRIVQVEFSKGEPSPS